jgi:hypothetical protein
MLFLACPKPALAVSKQGSLIGHPDVVPAKAGNHNKQKMDSRLSAVRQAQQITGITTLSLTLYTDTK